MNIVIFAGGSGTRLWPLSRKNSPKQFGVIKDGKSTLQMAIDRIEHVGLDTVHIATNERYIDLVKEQVPGLPDSNIYPEPDKRDLAAAIGLMLCRLKARGISGPIAVLWADHFMENVDNFVAALRKGHDIVSEEPKKIVFLGEKARFANHNLGWIQMGAPIDEHVSEFISWKYRPPLEECEKMFRSHDWVWNPGYFVFDIDFVLSLYEEHQSEMITEIRAIHQNEEMLQERYNKLESLSFDNAILEKISPNQAVVMRVDLGWSDPGTLYALKESLTESLDENFTKGNVHTLDTKDCLVYNEEEHKLVSTIGVEGVVIVNTKDALIVCDKNKVPDVKKLLKELESGGKGEYL